MWMRDNMQGAVKALFQINERETCRRSDRVHKSVLTNRELNDTKLRRPNQTPHPSAFLCATQCGRVSVAGQPGVPM